MKYLLIKVDPEEYKKYIYLINTDNIIRILAKNNLSISEAKEILNITSKKLDEQKVMENGVYRHWVSGEHFM